MSQQPSHEQTNSPDEVEIVARLLSGFVSQENLTYFDGRLPSEAEEPDLKKAAQPAKYPIRRVDVREVRQQWQQAAETLPGLTARVNELGEAIIKSYDWRYGIQLDRPELMEQLNEVSRAVDYFGDVEGHLLMQIAIARLSDRDRGYPGLAPIDVFHEVPKVAYELGFKPYETSYGNLLHSILHTDVPLMPPQGEGSV